MSQVMMLGRKFSYKHLLIIWLALGLSYCGIVFFMQERELARADYFQVIEQKVTYPRALKNGLKYTLLVALIIGSAGYTIRMAKKKSEHN